MASKTTNYGLNKHSPQDFYNVEARNENWDKIDTELKNNVDAINARVKTAELAAEVKKVVKDGSLTAADLGAEKAGAAAALEKKVDALGAGDVGADPTGTAVFVVGKAGAWSIKATKDSNSASGTVTISKSGESKTLTLTYANVFGVVWDTSNSSTALKRLTQSTDPYGLVNKSVTTEPKPAVGKGAGSSPFDSFLPWSGMKECNLDYDGSVKSWKDDSGFRRTDPYVMVWIPEFYFATKTNGTKKYFYIADGPVSGMKKHPGSGKFIGRYVMNHNCGSTTGGAPLVDKTRADARLSATIGGDKEGSKWHMYDFATYCAIIFLYIVEFADWDCQNKIAYGRANGQSSAVTSGKTDTMVYHTGTAGSRISDGSAAMQYRWIENLWGNVLQWVDGFNVNDKTAYYCTDPSKYADDTATGYTNIGTLPGSGWIKNLTVTDNGLLIPKTSGGSETTYVPDYVYSSPGWRVLSVGGDWGYGAAAGLLCFGANNASSDSDSRVSVRVLCEP